MAAIFWIPLVMSLGVSLLFLVAPSISSSFSTSTSFIGAAVAGAVGLLIGAYWLAKRHHTRANTGGKAGNAGDAYAIGDDSDAEGGAGGRSNGGNAGKGGTAYALGKGARAKGGAGGSG